jgi:hypothetical protein
MVGQKPTIWLLLRSAQLSTLLSRSSSFLVSQVSSPCHLPEVLPDASVAGIRIAFLHHV